MSTSHQIIERKPLVLEVDEHSNQFDLTLGTSFTSYGEPNFNAEIPNLTIEELTEIGIRLMEVISYYHPSPPAVVEALMKQVPEYKQSCF